MRISSLVLEVRNINDTYRSVRRSAIRMDETQSDFIETPVTATLPWIPENCCRVVDAVSLLSIP